MHVKKQITQSFVLLENEKEYYLEYYIFSEPTQNGNDMYGVEIIQSSGESSDSALATISSDKEYTLQIILSFAKNFVFPGSLNEIIEEMH